MRTTDLPYRPTASAHCSLLTAHSSLFFTFSAKEKDAESGLSVTSLRSVSSSSLNQTRTSSVWCSLIRRFGARYYSSDLSIWLSVDPMADKYPSLSPYVYCADNPVKLVDPNGEDWFENELTGDVYYSRDYRKGDESQIGGEGWKWMGENNMFGKSADDVITDNLDKADVFTQGDSYDRVGFFGKNAKDFMSKMGYKCVPTQVVEYEKSIMQRTWTPAGTLSVDIGGSFQIVEKVGYFFNTVFGGSVDMSNSGPCTPNWTLINKFLKKQ